MKHTPVAEISRVADVHPIPLKPPMTRVERLERWAKALERDPDRVLTSIEEIEWKSEAERRAMRSDNSALTAAFEDPMLRAEGLASDRLGDAMTFFRLSDPEAHFVLCSCVYGRSMQADVAARRVRTISRARVRRSDAVSRCEVTRHDLSTLWIAGTGLGGIIVASALLHLLS
jgi:hypothetical protein